MSVHVKKKQLKLVEIMKTFLDDNFLLDNQAAQRLYHDYAKDMPICDYHCHIPPHEIAANHQFSTLTEVWLKGDHYKWRAMRWNGIDEHFITGKASDREKFEKWAETVPYTMRNPLYHWTHLELQRTFGINDLLNPKTAGAIYDRCNDFLQSEEGRCQSLIQRWNVKYIGTTDDPIDSLEAHQQISKSSFNVTVAPSWRPDKTMLLDNPTQYNQYLDRLAEVSNLEISSYANLLDALKVRQDFFHEKGCRVSDHGLDRFYADSYSDNEINQFFDQIRMGKTLTRENQSKLKSAILHDLAVLNHEKGWVQQFHVGALRNNNGKMLLDLGPDTGFDSIDDQNLAGKMSGFLNRLAQEDCLTKTILYNLNPKDNDVFTTMAGNFQSGPMPGKIQYGSGWWFLDQKDGIEAQLNSLSNLGLLSRFIGMLTDSRSYLSYSRHEYFRRILCNLIGQDMEKGLLPHDYNFLGKMVQDICFNNARNYFQLAD